MKPAILLATGPWNPKLWEGPLAAADPDRPVFTYPDVPDRAAVRYALLWKSPADALARLPNLAAIFSLGAGVDHVVGLDLPPVPIVRIVDPDLTMRMTEHVVLHVLYHHRKIPQYQEQQKKHIWRELRQPAANAVRVGIMGLGELGRDAADVLVRLGFQVSGWSRTEKAVPGVACFAGADGLAPFLARTDILVVLLPLTPGTRGILDRRVFEGLARDGALPGPVVINAGRGGLQNEADLLAALDDGTLAGASLDVFVNEPLAKESRFWDHPRVMLTPHAAASSEASALAPGILAQIEAFERGEPLRNLVDRERAY